VFSKIGSQDSSEVWPAEIIPKDLFAAENGYYDEDGIAMQ
jgi:hypothetical protein